MASWIQAWPIILLQSRNQFARPDFQKKSSADSKYNLPKLVVLILLKLVVMCPSDTKGHVRMKLQHLNTV